MAQSPLFPAFFTALGERGFGPYSASGSPITTTVLWPPLGNQAICVLCGLPNDAGVECLYHLSAAEITGSAKSNPPSCALGV